VIARLAIGSIPEIAARYLREVVRNLRVLARECTLVLSRRGELLNDVKRCKPAEVAIDFLAAGTYAHLGSFDLHPELGGFIGDLGLKDRRSLSIILRRNQWHCSRMFWRRRGAIGGDK
jgi:hypothetical protein